MGARESSPQNFLGANIHRIFSKESLGFIDNV